MEGLRNIVIGVGVVIALGLSGCGGYYENIANQGMAEERQKTRVIQRQVDVRTEQEAYDNSKMINTTRRMGEGDGPTPRPSYYTQGE